MNACYYWNTADKVHRYSGSEDTHGKCRGQSNYRAGSSTGAGSVHLFYGDDDAGVENIEDVFFYIAFITEITAETAIYLITMKLIRKIRSK